MEMEEFQAMYEESFSYDNVPVEPGEMSPLERFENIMSFQKVDRIIDTEFGYWNETLSRWHEEGLPKFVDSNAKADVYFGFDRWKKGVPCNVQLNPSFKEEILSDDGHHKIILNAHRVKCQVFSDGKDSIPHYIDFSLKDRASYLPFKEKLNPDLEGRILGDYAKIGEQVKGRNYVLSTSGGSTAGLIRNWMGFEGICIAIYEQPELLKEILEDLANVSEAVANEIVKYMNIDLVSWWEDIAFKNGPIVTPDFFINQCGPVIQKVMSIYQRAGTRYAFVDCDGDFRKLMPGWLDNGVNIMFPLEVASGIHPESLRQENPGIRMMGGVDKVVLSKGREAIKAELKRLKPIVKEGGFIPHVDHRVQADVSYQDYLYYLEAKREIFEIPNRVAETSVAIAS